MAKSNSKKKEFFLVRWFKRCMLGDRKELSLEEEEKIQTPMRAMFQNFLHKKSAMFGLIVFLIVFVFVLVGLRDVTLCANLNLDTGGFLAFADMFMDNVFADYLVQRKISQARKQVGEAVRQVESIVGALRRKYREL